MIFTDKQQASGEADREGARRDINIPDLVTRLRNVRLAWREQHHKNDLHIAHRLPSAENIRRIIADLKEALFPMRLGIGQINETNEDFFVGHKLNLALTALSEEVRLELQIRAEGRAHDSTSIVSTFAGALPDIRALLDTDIEAAFHGDPAARSFDEVLICYPGVIAMIHHRIAHELYRLGAPLIARLIAEEAHTKTGIDIHPGARIGSYFFIDHGTGVVIGETCIIGHHVRIYQAVTLGARSFPRDADGHLRKSLPRHPVIEDDVVIYAGATILGRITIGKNSVIGGNIWLTEDVPAGSQIHQARSRSGLVAESDKIHPFKTAATGEEHD